jgi:hypothetical protein
MHPQVLSGSAWELVAELNRAGLLSEWTLCGGTGLALQFGHRLSEDLDFFHYRPKAMTALPGLLAEVGPVTILDRSTDTLHVRAGSTRLSFLGLEAPLLYPGIPYRGLMLGDARDIASLKLVALGGRGSRKDFIDLYFYLLQTPGLEAIFDHLEQRDSQIDWNQFHLLKSLTYFDDAEQEPMPNMLKQVDWQEVTQFFRKMATRQI